MQVLLNHVGYRPASAKRAIVQHREPIEPRGFQVVDARTRVAVHTGTLVPMPSVPGWKDRHFAAADFDAVTAPGTYVVVLDGLWPPVVSQPFEIDATLFGSQMLSDIVHYFKSQRCTGLL